MVKTINLPAENNFFKDYTINKSKNESGTIVLLNTDELLSSVIEQIDVNINNLGITIHHETFYPEPTPAEYQIDINNVKFDRFSKFIGYGSISSYHSIRYDLFFNEKTNSAYFEALDRKYTIKLNHSYITIINQNKKIWITLTQQAPVFINSNTEFNENDITIRII